MQNGKTCPLYRVGHAHTPCGSIWTILWARYLMVGFILFVFLLVGHFSWGMAMPPLTLPSSFYLLNLSRFLLKITIAALTYLIDPSCYVDFRKGIHILTWMLEIEDRFQLKLCNCHFCQVNAGKQSPLANDKERPMGVQGHCIVSGPRFQPMKVGS